MFLQPKQTKFRKHRKGKISAGIRQARARLQFGVFGLSATQAGSITARQIEAARQAITRKVKRTGRVWIRIFPDHPVTSRPIGVRMGKGTGSVDHWTARVQVGTPLFEIDGVPWKTAEVALRTGAGKLPVRTRVLV